MKISINIKNEKLANLLKKCYNDGYIYSLRFVKREFNLDLRNYDEEIEKFFYIKNRRNNRKELRLRQEYIEEIEKNIIIQQ